jgi:hypothetical protein
MRAVTMAVSVLALALVLQGCTAGGCSREEAPEFSAAHEHITRDYVVAELGEPIETFESEDGRRIDIYHYDKFCGGIIVLVPVVAFPSQMLTVEYGPDGSFLTTQVWPDAETPKEIITAYQREAERRARKAELPIALEACDLSYSEVAQLDPQIQYDLGTFCPTKSEGDGHVDPLRWQRTCLAAHGRHPDAQRRMGGILFNRGEMVQAYKWFKLGILNDGGGSVKYLSKKMTPDQLAEAERLVAVWQPNSTECETIGAQSEN